MLKCEVGTSKGSGIVVKGTSEDLAVDVAYVVARVYHNIRQQCPEGAQEFRDSLLKLMEADSPVWEHPAGGGTSICMVVPEGMS